MLIFVLTATYELCVSSKSHLRDHPNLVYRWSLSTCVRTVLLAGGFGSRCVLQIQLYVLARYSMKTGGTETVGVVVWLCNPILTILNALSLLYASSTVQLFSHD